MKLNKSLLYIIAIAISWIGSQSPSMCLEKSEAGYDIEQKSLLIGYVELRVSPSAIQMRDRGRGIMFVSRAPNWTVQVINPATKTFCECRVQDFSGAMNYGVALLTGKTLTDVTYAAKPKKESNGMLHFQSDEAYTQREAALRKGYKRNGGVPKTVDVWIDPAIPVPPQAIALICRLYGITPCGGMPVRVRFLDFDGDEKVFLTTSSVEKKNLAPEDFFRRSSAYKRVANAMVVYRSSQQDDAVGEMLQSLGTPLFKNQK